MICGFMFLSTEIISESAGSLLITVTLILNLDVWYKFYNLVFKYRELKGYLLQLSEHGNRRLWKPLTLYSRYFGIGGKLELHKLMISELLEIGLQLRVVLVSTDSIDSHSIMWYVIIISINLITSPVLLTPSGSPVLRIVAWDVRDSC